MQFRKVSVQLKQLVFEVVLCVLQLVVFQLHVRADQSVVLSWNPSSSPIVAGYKIYFGSASRSYVTNIVVGNVTTATINGLTEGETYYFAAKTYDAAGDESDFSNEASYSVPVVIAAAASAPSAIATATATATTTTAKLTTPARSGGQFSFAVTGKTGQPYAVQASSDLVHWVFLQTNTAPFKFTDTAAAAFPQRFYRTVYLDPTATLAGSSRTNGHFSFTVAGIAGLLYVIEASSDLVNWVAVTTNTTPFRFVDTDTTAFQQRFYRAKFLSSADVTAAAAAATMTALTASTNRSSGPFSFNVAGLTGQTYVVEASADLVNWVSVQTNTAPFTLVDPDAPKYPQRFYRTFYQP